MPFYKTNVAEGVQSATFQVGRNNVDDDYPLEIDEKIPWSSDPKASYVYYDCALGVALDSGIVVHNRLPQTNGPFVDTLATIAHDDPRLDQLTGYGVNLRCLDQYRDIIQRMGHARYWFRLWGQALRVGHQVPIPGIRFIGGAVAIPYDKNPQWAYNTIVPGGNYSGAVLWRAQWSLWYTTITPPGQPLPGAAELRNISQSGPAAGNPSAHINPHLAPPQGMQAPYSQSDDNAQPTGPRT